MRRIPLSGLTALTSALALVVAAIPLGAVASGPVAQAPTAAISAEMTGPAGNSAGKLRLTTTSSLGIVEWNGKRQEFTAGQQCAIVDSAGTANLLDLKGYMGGIPGTAGFRNGNIGVFEFDNEGDGPNNAAQCAQVDSGSFAAQEKLGLYLDLDGDAGDSVSSLSATRATVSLAAQSRDGAYSVTLVGVKDGEAGPVPPRTWSRLKSGAAITVDTKALFPNFTGTFTGIELTAISGNFSVRGAEFDVIAPDADAFLGCGANDTKTFSTGDQTVTLIGTADGSPCTGFGITLEQAGDGTVYFYKPLDVTPTAQFILDFVWTVSPANTSGDGSGALLPETTIDYEQGTVPNDIPLRWCPDVTTDNGKPTGIFDVLNNEAAVDQEPKLDGKQFTCIVSQDATVVNGDPDFVEVNQTVYLLGDAAYRFK